MTQILSLLNEMRGRLGMYVGESSLTKLAAFLRGFDHAIHQIRPEEDDRFLEQFRDWIHHRFQTTRHSWEDTIMLQSKNEADAVKRFWELFDEYVKKREESAVTNGTLDVTPRNPQQPTTA